MKKHIAFLMIVFSVFVFSASLNGSFKIGYSVDFSQDPVAKYFYYDLWLNLNSSAMEVSLNTSLHWNELDSFEAHAALDDLSISVFKNRIFATSPDQLMLYKFDSGEDGFVFSYQPFKAVFSVKDRLYYYTLDFGWMKGIYGIRDGVNDLALDFQYSGFLKFFGEGLVNVTEDSSVGYYYFVGIADPSMKYGVKYYDGDNPYLPEYTAVNSDYVKVMNIWGSFGDFRVWSNLDFKDFTGMSDFGFHFDWNSLWFEVYKKGVDLSILSPVKANDFYVSMGLSGNLLGFGIKGSYTFGKPIHNTVGTLGDLYYFEISRSFGSVSAFAKVQYIYGYYERKLDAYFEMKWSGFSNAEFKLTVGNGDFYNNNTFSPVVAAEINSWW